MPPVIALSLCTAFVLYLLWLDQQESPDVSPVSWIPTLWMIYTASKPLGVWFRTAATDIESGSPLDQIFLILILCLGLLVLVWRNFRLQEAVQENKWLMLLLCYMLVSTVWSDIPFVSMKRWIRELIAVVMAGVIVTETDPRRAALSVLRRSAYILIPFSLLLIKYFPFYGVQYGRWSGALSWVGVTTQKNGLGRLCFIASFFLIWSLVSRWRKKDVSFFTVHSLADVTVMLLSLLLLIGPEGAYSASAIVALGVGLAVFTGLVWMEEQQTSLQAVTMVFGLVLIIIFGTVTVFVGGETVGGFTSNLGRDTTLTGRTDVWGALVPVVYRQPLLGSGFGGFWTYRTREVYQISEGHSGYLDVLLDLGFVGLLLVSMFLITSCVRAGKQLENDFDWAVLWIGYLIMAAVHNIAESSFDTLTSQLTAVLVFLAAASMQDSSDLPADQKRGEAGDVAG